VPQFSEDGAVSKKINEYFSSAPVPTQKEDEVLALIGDKCTRGCFLTTGNVAHKYFQFLSWFHGQEREISELLNSERHIPEDGTVRLLTKSKFEKSCKMGSWAVFFFPQQAQCWLCCTLFHQNCEYQNSKFHSETGLIYWR